MSIQGNVQQLSSFNSPEAGNVGHTVHFENLWLEKHPRIKQSFDISSLMSFVIHDECWVIKHAENSVRFYRSYP